MSEQTGDYLSATSGRLISKDSYYSRLDEIDRSNLDELARIVGEQAREKGLDIRLVAVGGTVDPSRIGQPHKDIDVICYCPQLAVVNNPRETDSTAFSGFFRELFDKKGWKFDAEDAFWDGFDHSGDGKVIVKPSSGKPVEIIPVRKDFGRVISYEEFLKRSSDKGIVILS